MPKDILDRPDDLISAEEAAQIAGRKKDTIRSWVRNDKLRGFRADPKKQTSALMVSATELLIYLSSKSSSAYRERQMDLSQDSMLLREKDSEITKLERELALRDIRCQSLERQLTDLISFNETLQLVLTHRSDELSSLRNQMHTVLDLQAQLQLDYQR